MDKKLFAELAENMQQMGEVTRGERAPSREIRFDPMEVKKTRAVTGLSQAQFARAISVEVGTLRNWEQGRRSPTGPAQALLKAVRKDPEHVMRALCD